ncbi:MAG: DUF3761 domain-containing protein [Candidimonas sp.]|nr:MAG: DUF3761 domain-containing protein [Candidimonas sp.]
MKTTHKVRVATILTAVCLSFLSLTTWAKSTPKQAGYQAPQESSLIEHGHYTNKNGEVVHSPAHTKNGSKPSGATAQCRDGTYSFSRSHRGTCSGHHGVAQWE